MREVKFLTDEIFYYAYENEKSDQSPASSLVEELDEVDRFVTYHTGVTKIPWTHIRPQNGSSGDMYQWGDNYNFLAVTVQARLVKYVRAKLDANPSSVRKDGRPLLGFALHPRRPMGTQYRIYHNDQSVNVDSKLRPYEVHVRHTLTVYHHLCSGTATPRTWGRSKPAYPRGG